MSRVRTAWLAMDMYLRSSPRVDRPVPPARALISEPTRMRKPAAGRRKSWKSRYPRTAGDGAFKRGALGRRQLDEKARAAIEVVGLGGRELDAAAVADDEVGGDRQAEAGPRLAGRLVERLEDARRFCSARKARPGVADLDQRHAVGADRGEADRLGPPGRRALGHQRLRGVAAQVLEHPQDVVRVGVDLEPGRNVDMVVDRVGRARRGRPRRRPRTISLRSNRRRSGGRSRPAP